MLHVLLVIKLNMFWSISKIHSHISAIFKVLCVVGGVCWHIVESVLISFMEATNKKTVKKIQQVFRRAYGKRGSIWCFKSHNHLFFANFYRKKTENIHTQSTKCIELSFVQFIFIIWFIHACHKHDCHLMMRV